MTVTQAERQPLYEEATRQIVADSPDIWVYNSMQLHGVTKRVKGFRFCPSARAPRCAGCSWRE